MANTAREPGLWDRLVNDKFNGEQPVLSPDESVRAAKRLYKRAMGKPWLGAVKTVSGRRYTWVRGKVMSVNPDMPQRHARGLRAIIHDISHYAHSRLNPNDAPHSARQAYIERDLVDYAIQAGFADGALKSKAKPKVLADKVVARYNAMVNRRDKWAKEAERATRLLKKAEGEVRTYEKRHGERLKP